MLRRGELRRAHWLLLHRGGQAPGKMLSQWSGGNAGLTGGLRREGLV